jgi:hypothetical protein
VAKSSSIRSFVRLAALGAVVAALAPTSAQAGLLATGSASYCDPTVVQPFAPWGDDSNYMLVAGGSFEGANVWMLRGGAQIVSGNEPFYVNDANDAKSLYLPAGASVVSPTVCFKFADWHARFFLRDAEQRAGYLKVEVIVPSVVGGVLAVLDGGIVDADGRWQPSERVGLTLCNVSSLLGTKAVAFRLTAVGTAYQVDDFYLDPYKSS